MQITSTFSAHLPASSNYKTTGQGRESHHGSGSVRGGVNEIMDRGVHPSAGPIRNSPNRSVDPTASLRRITRRNHQRTVVFGELLGFVSKFPFSKLNLIVATAEIGIAVIRGDGTGRCRPCC